MSNFVIALLAAIGASTWIYTRLQNSTGGASWKSSLTVTGVSGLVILVFMLFLLNAIS